MADFERYKTVAQVVAAALGELSLAVPVGGVLTSTDETVTQMVALLRASGEELTLNPYNWQVFKRSFTVTTVPGTTDYALPLDWDCFLDDTGWNQTSRIPLAGPVTDQTWRTLKARALGSDTFVINYIIRENKLMLYSSPSAAQSLIIDYMGRGWVQDANDPLVFKDNFTKDGDVVQFPSRVITTKLKWAWRAEKGFDTSHAQQEFLRNYTAATSKDSPGPSLPLGRAGRYPYLGYVNIPDTGYGS